MRADAIGGGGAGVDVDDDDDDVIACQNLTAYYLLFPLFCYRINTHTLPSTPYTLRTFEYRFLLHVCVYDGPYLVVSVRVVSANSDCDVSPSLSMCVCV